MSEYKTDLTEQKRKLTTKQFMALGASTLALLGPAIYVGVQKDPGHEQQAAGQMLELYGEAALGAGALAASRRMRQLATDHNRQQQDSRPLPPLLR